MNVSEIRNIFIEKLKNHKQTYDPNHNTTIEIISASFLADEPTIFGKINSEYIDAEIQWYFTQSTNINDLPYSPIPKAWESTANKYGEINSNYGYLVFSGENYNQYQNVLRELRKDSRSRRATVIYTRPSIWLDYNSNGKNDFICTNAVTYYIRNNRLTAVVQMRSNDVVFGYKNDFAWQDYMLNVIANELEIKKGSIYWQCQNLHLYEKHFKYAQQ